jgi:hypothetical protein
MCSRSSDVLKDNAERDGDVVLCVCAEVSNRGRWASCVPRIGV